MTSGSDADLHIIFLSDTHLGFDYPLRPKIRTRRRGEDFYRNFIAVLSYARNKQADLVIHGGDLFFRSRIPGFLIDKAYNAILEFADSTIPIYLIPGNHERSHLPLPLLLRHPSVFIFDRPKTYIHPFRHGVINLTGFPFERENVRNKFSTLLRNAGWESIDSGLRLLCLHQLIEGVRVGPQGYSFLSGSDVIRQNDLPENAHAVLAGHVHRGQEVQQICAKTQPFPTVLFAGSTERTSFAEQNETKGFYHLVFFRNGSDQWSLKQKDFVPLETSPMLDFMIDDIRSPQALTSRLESSLKFMDRNIIIRFNCLRRPDPGLKSCLTIKWFRQRLPDTVSFCLAKNLFK